MAYDHLIGAGLHRWTHGTYTPGQLELLADWTSPAILYSGAYRAGKTEICARGAVQHAIMFPRSRFGVFRAKLKSLKQSTLRTVLELVPGDWVEDWNNSELILRLKNKSEISFLGCDFADRIGSIELSGAFIDEAHEVSEESFGMIVGRMSAPLYVDATYLESVKLASKYDEAVARSRTRQTLLACNPKSKSHWLYRDFIDPETRLPGRKFYSSNTITNRNLPDSYLEQNLAQYARPGVTEEAITSSVFRVREGLDPQDGMHLVPVLTPFGQRNLLGLWVALEGAIYALDRRTQWIPVQSSWGLPVKYWAGVDFGFQHPRIVVLAQYENGHTSTVGYWAGSKVGPDPLLRALEEADQQFNLNGIFFPHDQPGIVQKARTLLPAHKIRKADNKVLSGIGSVQVALNGGYLSFQDQMGPWNKEHGDLFWAEMEGYQWKRDKDGNWLDEPLKEGDHFPDALRYAVHSLIRLQLWKPEHKKDPRSGDPWLLELGLGG